MHIVLFAVWLLGLRPVPEYPQTATSGYNAIASVISYRQGWLDDGTPFDACSVYRALGEPTDFPAGFDESIRARLEPDGESCLSSGRANDPRSDHNIVRLDSIRISSSDTAMVYLTVSRGEYFHRENYTLVNPTAHRWGVKDVLIWGSLRLHRPRREPRGNRPLPPPFPRIGQTGPSSATGPRSTSRDSFGRAVPRLAEVGGHSYLPLGGVGARAGAISRSFRSCCMEARP